MTILGIETSCDETGVAIIEINPPKIKLILFQIRLHPLSIHSKTGGIIPDMAAREQVRYMIPVLESALKSLSKKPESVIDAIAVTVGPGLIGSLLVGVETARTLAYVWKKPIIPVNHLIGHIYANWLTDYCLPSTVKQKAVVGSLKAVVKQPEFPLVALVVSGGHTDLVLLKDHKKIKWLGGTRDDAAGEAFDKIGRLLNLLIPADLRLKKQR